MCASEIPSSLFVILETTEIPALQMLVTQLVQQQPVAQIIINEAHIISSHRFCLVRGTFMQLISQ